MISVPQPDYEDLLTSTESPLHPPTPIPRVDSAGVMSRMDWFRHLQVVYTSLQQDTDQLVHKYRLEDALNKADLPLRLPEVYYREGAERAFSHSEVRRAISELKDMRVAWDQVIDAIYSISTLKNPGSEPVRPVTDAITTFAEYQSVTCSPLKSQLVTQVVILNLTHCKLLEFELHCVLPSLRLLNLASNSLTKVTMLQRCKSLREVYLANNRLTSLSSLCHLHKLKLLDLTDNLISAFEIIACLAINYKLKAVSLVGNPLAKRENYRQTVQMLLPNVQHVDPASIKSLSHFLSRSNEAFGESKSLESVGKIRMKRENLGREMSKTPVPNRTDGGAMSPKPVRAQTPMMRRYSQEVLVQQSFDDALSVLTEAERRLDQFPSPAQPSRHQHSFSLVTPDTIEKAHKNSYGNPVAAMMIGPPACACIRRKKTSQGLRKLSVSRGRKPLGELNGRGKTSKVTGKRGKIGN